MSFASIINVILPPLSGETAYITSRYGPRNCKECSSNHKGVDVSYSGRGGGVISTKPPFYSPVNGTVVTVGPKYKMNQIVIKDSSRTINGKPIFHRFLHSEEIIVKPGDSVSAGQKLGRVGNRGAKTGQTHVHYEIRVGGAGALDSPATDPIAFWDGAKQSYIPDVPKEVRKVELKDPHEEDVQFYKTEAGAPPIPETPPKAIEIEPPVEPSGQIDDYKPRQAGNSSYSSAQPALWTNRVPEHEPWPRVLMGDTLHINAPSDEYEINTRHHPQYDENHKDVGRVEGEDVIKRGPFWRR